MRIIIADDHTLFKDALSEYIQRKMPGVKLELLNDFEGVKKALQQNPQVDLVMLDFQMPGMGSLEGFKYMRAQYPDIKVALISGFVESDQIHQILDLGAVGYFPKTMPGKEFVEAIEHVCSGNRFVPIDVNTHDVMHSYISDEDSDVMQNNDIVNAAGVYFTPREKDVLSGLLKGQSNKEIGNALGIREVTIKLHIRSICDKLGANNRTQAAMKARDFGFIA